MLTKKELSGIMHPQMAAIIYQWDSYGEIFETQFDFAFQHMFKTSVSAAYETIVENGGHRVTNTSEKDDLSDPICLAIEVANEGWMYYFFDPNMLEVDTAKKNAEKYFIDKFS